MNFTSILNTLPNCIHLKLSGLHCIKQEIVLFFFRYNSICLHFFLLLPLQLTTKVINLIHHIEWYWSHELVRSPKNIMKQFQSYLVYCFRSTFFEKSKQSKYHWISNYFTSYVRCCSSYSSNWKILIFQSNSLTARHSHLWIVLKDYFLWLTYVLSISCVASETLYEFNLFFLE